MRPRISILLIDILMNKLIAQFTYLPCISLWLYSLQLNNIDILNLTYQARLFLAIYLDKMFLTPRNSITMLRIRIQIRIVYFGMKYIQVDDKRNIKIYQYEG